MNSTLLFLLLLTSSDPNLQFEDSIVVSAIRADDETPVTKTDISREEIEREYQGEDLPLFLRRAPSIHSWAESGAGGAGYSYISLRGISSSRINFTLDGVPLADSEDMTTYFVDFPDLARSLQSIQIQRGVGTSTFGSASFGGSVNLESIDVGAEQRVDATVGVGSFGNRQATAAWHTGELSNGLAFYTRASFLESEGYRERSATRQSNIFFSGEAAAGAAQLRLTGFSGREEQQLSFYAADEATLEENRRGNPLREEEKDQFNYDLAQLQYLRPLGEASSMTASLYYQRGYGWYRLFDFGTDVLAEYGLDGVLAGSILTYSRSDGALTTNYGLHVNRFKRDHTRDDVASGTRDHANYGVKQEANAFAKASFDAGRWHLYGDAQVRHATFDYHGEADVPAVSWTFFNPKLGARYALTPSASFYASAGFTTREPARNDMFHGEDNPSIPYDPRDVRPERVTDFEAGWQYQTRRLDLAANVYAMEFRDEIAATGELSEVGLPLRRNVDRSHRRGVELDLRWRIDDRWRSETTASLSHNRIDEWTQFFDVYDDAGNWTGSEGVVYDDVEPLLTPAVIVNQTLAYRPSPRFDSGVSLRYTGASWLDNTNDSSFRIPAYVTADARVSYLLVPWARLTLHVNNVLDHDALPAGYSYRYMSGGTPDGIAYFFPHATRNVMLLFDFEL